MSQGDMFLQVEGVKHGKIKGEAQDDSHQDEIDVLGWSWGMKAKSAMSGAGATGKAALHELSVRKQVDSASAGLMSAMHNNEMIKKAVLTVRKAGQSPSPLEYFKITIQGGRITSIDVGSGDGDNAELVETLSFAFQRISVEYVPQGPDGQPRGGMMFEADIS
jgi:type VI secretion system secreted protein Hcp